MTETIPERIRSIMAQHGLSCTRFAAIIQTPAKTVEKWLAGSLKPPKCMAALLDVLEQSEEARQLLGVHKPKPKAKAPRGRPFEPGNPWRFGGKV
jgi:hypothetical protein